MDRACISCLSRDCREWIQGFRKCNACGLWFRDAMPAEADLKGVHEGHYSGRNAGDGTVQLLSTEESLDNHADFIRRIVEPPARVLDFGAGTGGLVRRLASAGYPASGCEYSDGARAEAKSRHGLVLYPSLDETRGTYDLIAVIEVVEHLLNPRKIMARLHERLNPNGILYLATPNTNGLRARLQGGRWREAIRPYHVALYNYRALRTLAMNSGFREVRYVRFSPLTSKAIRHRWLHRALQSFGLYGGLRVLCYK